MFLYITRIDDLTSPSPMIEIMFKVNLVWEAFVNAILNLYYVGTHFFKKDQSWIFHDGLAVGVKRLV